MISTARLKVSGFVVALAVLGAGCSGGGGGGGATTATTKPVEYDASDKVASPAVELRSKVTSLLQEHVLLAGITASTLVAGQDAGAASAVLDQNSVALADVITGLYGPPTGEQFLALWRRSSAATLDFVAGSVAGDQARIDKAKADTTAVHAELVALLNSVNPQLTPDALEEPLGSFATMLQTALTGYAKRDAAALPKLKEAADDTRSTAIALVAGIVKHKGEDVPGDVGAMSAVMRTSLTTKLQQHVYLAGIATGTALSGGQLDPAMKALDDNSLELSRALGAVYGDDVARKFLTLWRRHNQLIVDFAEAAVTGDPTWMINARSALDAPRAAVVDLLASANPNLSRDALGAELGSHVTTMLAAVEAQAAKDPGQVLKLREAALRMPGTALLLATGIARQFPDKFG